MIQQANFHNRQQATYCLFRIGEVWLAVQAKVIREVMAKPRLVSIPRSHAVLSGMSYLRSEFVPVLNFSSLFPEETAGQESFMLIIEDVTGDWGLMVDEVDTLAVLESSNAPDEGRNGWETAVVGWATKEDRIIRVLDTVHFRELAAVQLASDFQSSVAGLGAHDPAGVSTPQRIRSIPGGA